MANAIKIQLDADVKKAISGIEDFSRKSSDSLGALESTFGVIKTAAAAAFALFLGNEVIDGVKKIVAAASESEKSISQLNVALKLSGDFTEEASKHFQDLASELQKTTTFTDEAVLGGVALAKSFNLSNEETEKLVRAAANLSATTGQDLNASVQLLGRSYDGTAGKLNELIPSVRDLTASQLQAGGAVDIVTNRFKGAAEAAGKTFGGNVTKAKNAFDDLLETLGNFIIKNPVIIKLIEKAGEAFSEMQKFVEKNSKAISSFVTEGIIFLVKSFDDLIVGLKQVVTFLDKLSKPFRVLSQDLGNFLTKVLSIDIVKTGISEIGKAIADTINTVIKTLKLLIDNFKDLPGVSKVLKHLGIDVDELSETLDDASKSIDDFADGFDTTKVQEGIDNLNDGFNDVSDGVDKAFNGLETALGSAHGKTKGLVDIIKEIGKAQVQSAKDAADALKNQTHAVETLTKAQREQVLTAVSANPIAAAAGQVETPKGTTPLEIGVGIGAGIIEAIGKGAQGAQQLITQGLGAAVEAFAPGFGKIATQILDILAQGPEKIAEFIKAFVDAIPKVVTNIIKAVPVLIKGILDGIPQIVGALVRSVPDIIRALVHAVPEIITSLVNEIPLIIQSIIDSIPAIIDALVEAIPRLVIFLVTEAPKIILSIIEKIPDLINSLISKIPDIIQSIISHLPEIIQSFILGLVSGAPTIILELIKSIPLLVLSLVNMMPRIVISLITEIITHLPEIIEGLVAGVVDAGRQFLRTIVDGIKGFLNGIIDFINGIITFFGADPIEHLAKGGTVPQGFQGDNFKASLQTGELVVPQNDNRRLQAFLDGQGNQSQGGLSKSDVTALIAAMDKSAQKDLTIKVIVSDKEIAQALININRQGLRTA